MPSISISCQTTGYVNVKEHQAGEAIVMLITN